MIELHKDTLVVSFPEIHPEAKLEVVFHRTLRIPDDGLDYPLPPGLGHFPLRHVDDFAGSVPKQWIRHGGIMFPMYQSEAMWLSFRSSYIHDRETRYPFAIKVAAGKINAVTGQDWSNTLHDEPQDYLVAPSQPWLDGYCVEKGFIRQFVAMPLGSGYTAEEQLTGKAEHGGLQLIVHPMKKAVFEKRFPKVSRTARSSAMSAGIMSAPSCAARPDMGLAMGGRMRQEIYEDEFGFKSWDRRHRSRCFVHIANSMVWRSITGQDAPTTPPTAKDYSRAGLPWFDYYDDSQTALEGSRRLNRVKSVMELARDKKDNPLPENESAVPGKVVALRKGLRKGQVREGAF